MYFLFPHLPLLSRTCFPFYKYACQLSYYRCFHCIIITVAVIGTVCFVCVPEYFSNNIFYFFFII